MDQNPYKSPKVAQEETSAGTQKATTLIVRFMWLLVVAGGGFLYWWYMHGPWRNAGNDLIEHDIVRFGPIPMFGTLIWVLFLLLTLIVSTHRFRRQQRGWVNANIVGPQSPASMPERFRW